MVLDSSSSSSFLVLTIIPLQSKSLISRGLLKQKCSAQAADVACWLAGSTWLILTFQQLPNDADGGSRQRADGCRRRFLTALALPTHTFLHLTGWWASAGVGESTTSTTLPSRLSVPSPSSPPPPAPSGLSGTVSYIFAVFRNFFPPSLVQLRQTRRQLGHLFGSQQHFFPDGDAKAQINAAFRASQKTKQKTHAHAHKKYRRTWRVC